MLVYDGNGNNIGLASDMIWIKQQLYNYSTIILFLFSRRHLILTKR